MIGNDADLGGVVVVVVVVVVVAVVAAAVAGMDGSVEAA